MTSHRLLVALVAAAAGACDPEDDPAGTCSTDLISGGAEVPDALRVGFAGAGGFAPIASGDAFELVMGVQGGWMVQPIARLDADRFDAADCPRLVLTLAVDDLAYPASYDLRTTFRAEDGSWTSDPIDLFISFDIAELEGRGATLSASVTNGDDTDAVTFDGLTLVNDI